MKTEVSSQNILLIYCIYKNYYLGLGDDLGLLPFDRSINVDSLLTLIEKNCIHSFTINAKVIGGDYVKCNEKTFKNLPLASDLHYYEEINISYKINYEVIKNELQKYINEWRIGNIHKYSYENIIKPDAQILKVLELIKRYNEEYISKEQMNFSSHDFDDKIELIEVLLILESAFIISLDQIYFSSSESGYQDGNINFQISINKNTFKKSYNFYKNKISHRIVLNEDTGVVSLEGKELGKIKVHTQPYMFFKYLYDNLGISKSHEDIHKHIFQGTKTEKLISYDLADMKRELPDKVKGLIETQKGHYIIP